MAVVAPRKEERRAPANEISAAPLVAVQRKEAVTRAQGKEEETTPSTSAYSIVGTGNSSLVAAYSIGAGNLASNDAFTRAPGKEALGR